MRNELRTDPLGTHSEFTCSRKTIIVAMCGAAILALLLSSVLRAQSPGWKRFERPAPESSLLRVESRVRLQSGTKIAVRLESPVGTRENHAGDIITGTVVEDVLSETHRVVIPSGSRASLVISQCKRAGHIKGRALLRVRLYAVEDARGAEVPLNGYATNLETKKLDREGTAKGRRGWGKDSAVDLSAVAVGTGIGMQVGGPWGLPAGAAGGLLVAGIWTVARRGPDLEIPRGTTFEFVLSRPVALAASSYTLDEGTPGTAAGSTWGQGLVIPPSADLLALLDRADLDPKGTLDQLKKLKFKDRPTTDKTFAKYVQALCWYKTGDRSKALKQMREVYQETKSLNFPPQARGEVARNLVAILRGTNPDWARDPILDDAEVQAALVNDAVQEDK